MAAVGGRGGPSGCVSAQVQRPREAAIGMGVGRQGIPKRDASIDSVSGPSSVERCAIQVNRCRGETSWGPFGANGHDQKTESGGPRATDDNGRVVLPAERVGPAQWDGDLSALIGPSSRLRTPFA